MDHVHDIEPIWAITSYCPFSSWRCPRSLDVYLWIAGNGTDGVVLALDSGADYEARGGVDNAACPQHVSRHRMCGVAHPGVGGVMRVGL